MCKKYLEEKLKEFPSWLMNLILLIFITFCLFVIVAMIFLASLQPYFWQVIQLLALLFGTLVVGNSITLYRSKTVSNELIRSNIDTINHCLTNEKLKIETYNAVLSANHNAETLDKLDAEDAKKAKKEAGDALKVYLELCNDLNAKSESCEGDIAKKTCKKCLGHLRELIKTNWKSS